MTKKLFTGLNLFVFISMFSQNGINTHKPEGALDIRSPNNDWGLVLPHVDRAEKTKNPTGKSVKKGTIIYDIEDNCMKYFNGNEWSGCLSALKPNPIKIECISNFLNLDIVAHYTIASGTTVSIPYSNFGEDFDYAETTIMSNNVTGLRAVLTSGSLKTGSGNLVFSISGIPFTSGEAEFSLSIAGVRCEFVIVVKNNIDICEEKDQLIYTTLRGKHIINGNEVTVDFSGSNLKPGGKGDNCNGVTIDSAFHLGDYYKPSNLTITFSRPVTNVGITLTAANIGEEYTLSTNNNQPIHLKVNSSCFENIKVNGNKISFNAERIGGHIIVGGESYTELTIKHNGQKGFGSLFSFCLNSKAIF